MDKIKESILAQDTAMGRWKKLCTLALAGFMRSDDMDRLAIEISEIDPEFSKIRDIDVPDELVNKSDGQVSRKWFFDVDTLLKYSPTGDLSEIWIEKELPENTTGKSVEHTIGGNKLGYLALISFMEEYGFVKVDNWLISRTISPIFWVDNVRYKIPRKYVMVLPSCTEEDFMNTYPTRAVIGGGLHFSGIYSTLTQECSVSKVLHKLKVPSLVNYAEIMYVTPEFDSEEGDRKAVSIERF